MKKNSIRHLLFAKDHELTCEERFYHRLYNTIFISIPLIALIYLLYYLWRRKTDTIIFSVQIMTVYLAFFLIRDFIRWKKEKKG